VYEEAPDVTLRNLESRSNVELENDGGSYTGEWLGGK
jgi:hypothetical protein